MGLRTPLYDWHAAHGGRDGRVRRLGHAGAVYRASSRNTSAVRTGCGLFDISHMGRLVIRRRRRPRPHPARLHEQRRHHEGRPGPLRPRLQRARRHPRRRPRLPLAARLVDGRQRLQPRRRSSTGCPPPGRTRVASSIRRETTAMLAVQGPKALELCRGLIPIAICPASGITSPADALPGRPVHREPHRLHRRGRRRGHACRPDIAVRLGRTHRPRREAMRPRRPRHAASRGRDAAVRPRIERRDRPAPGRPRLGGEARQGRLHRPRRHPRRKEDETRPVRVGLELDGRRAAREGAVVSLDGRPVGRVTSGTFAPTLDKAIAMAYVEPALSPPGQESPSRCAARAEPARVVPLPFYRRPA